MIALVGAVLVGGFLLFKGRQSSEVAAPVTTPVASATGATGATGAAKRAKAPKGATGVTGATGSTGPTTETAAEIRAKHAAALRKKAAAAGMPLAVYEAKRQGKIVMVFFWEPQGKDDQQVNYAIKNLERYRGKKLVVFREQISNKSKYDGIAQAAEITQTPGVIVIYRNKADSWQGYIDADALNGIITRLTGDPGKSGANCNPGRWVTCHSYPLN